MRSVTPTLGMTIIGRQTDTAACRRSTLAFGHTAKKPHRPLIPDVDVAVVVVCRSLGVGYAATDGQLGSVPIQ